MSPSRARGTMMCVFIPAVPITNLIACGCGGRWRTCATRDDEPRPVWTSLPTESVAESRTSERGGEEYCVKEGGGEEGEL